eukprot:scpid9210/ scgid23342/ 
MTEVNKGWLERYVLNKAIVYSNKFIQKEEGKPKRRYAKTGCFHTHVLERLQSDFSSPGSHDLGGNNSEVSTTQHALGVRQTRTQDRNISRNAFLCRQRIEMISEACSAAEQSQAMCKQGSR